MWLRHKKIMYRITNRLTNTNLYKFSAFAPKIKSFFPDASYSCSTLSLQNCLTDFILGIFEWNVALKCLWDKNNEVFLSTVSCTSKLSPSQEQDELAESSWVWHTASVLSEHIFKVRKDFSYKVVEAQKVRATLNALRPLKGPVEITQQYFQCPAPVVWRCGTVWQLAEAGFQFFWVQKGSPGQVWQWILLLIF